MLNINPMQQRLQPAPTNSPQGGGNPQPSYLQYRPQGQPATPGRPEVPGDANVNAGSTARLNPANGFTPGRLQPNDARPSAPMGAPQLASGGQSAPVQQPQGAAPRPVPQQPNDANPSAPRPMQAPPTPNYDFARLQPAGLRPNDANPSAPVNAPATQSNAPVPLTNMGSVIEQQLGNPSRFDAPEVQNAYNFMKGDISHERDMELGQAANDAASRGVFYGSPLTDSKNQINQQYQRGLGSLATNLALNQAQTYQSDRTQALNNAMSFLNMGNQMDQEQFDRAAEMANLGMMNGPNPNMMMYSFGPMPEPVGNGFMGPDAMKALGGLAFPGMFGPQSQLGGVQGQRGQIPQGKRVTDDTQGQNS